MVDSPSRALLRWLEEHRREMIELLMQLARAESPSLDPEAQRGPFRILSSELEHIDFVVRAVRNDEGGDTCMRGHDSAYAVTRASS